MLKCACGSPWTASPTPLFPSMKSYMEQLVLIISAMAKTVRNTFILVTHSNIYTLTYLHMLFLWVVYISTYCLGLAITFNQSFKVSSYELSTKPPLIWVIGSWIQPPLETKLLSFGKPSPSIWAAHFLRDYDLPLETLSSKPLLALLCQKRLLRNQYFFENTWVVLITLSRSCLEWEQRLNDLWAWRVNESGKFSLN